MFPLKRNLYAIRRCALEHGEVTASPAVPCDEDQLSVVLGDQKRIRDAIEPGLAQVRNWVKLKFAAMNLKKYANRLWKDTHPNYISSIFPHMQEPQFCLTQNWGFSTV